MNITLVILAAGIGSRFGGGVKQLTSVDDYGHLIIDYSIHDAISAGFNKIVFIIRHDIDADFKAIIGNRIEKIALPLGVEIAYAFQEIAYLPIKVKKDLLERTKPWGTGHAVLCAADQINSPFVVINADDYYGKEGFKKAAEFLGSKPDRYGLIGYTLKNTLSDHGGVTRGICKTDNGKLKSIVETKNIVKTADGAGTDGKKLDVEALVSMNFWCYPLEFLDVLRAGFPAFLESMADPMKDEYLLPIIADGMLKEGTEFTVLPTSDQWFGVTYKEDKDAVIMSFRRLIEDGVYSTDLYSDL